MDFWFGGWSRWIGKRVDLRLLSEIVSRSMREAVLAGCGSVVRHVLFNLEYRLDWRQSNRYSEFQSLTSLAKLDVAQWGSVGQMRTPLYARSIALVR
jgi:hypothetical protein